MKYRKKPVVIEAEQFSILQSSSDWSDFLKEAICAKSHNGFNGGLHIHTLEGLHDVRDGDFIIKGVKGEFYPCKPDIFEMTYEKV
jgi:hypothetical protein